MKLLLSTLQYNARRSSAVLPVAYMRGRNPTLFRTMLWVVAIVVIPNIAQAICTIGASAIVFGDYDVFNPTALDSTGNINIVCVLTMSYSVDISSGSGSFTTRTMVNGPYTLNYNLYTDSTRSIIWGDGSGGTSIISNFALLANHSVYGRIPAQQNAHIGSYSDAVIVTVTF